MSPRRARPVRGASSSPAGSLLDRLVERIPDIVFRVRLSPRPRLEYVNPAVFAVTGYSPDEWYADPSVALRLLQGADRRKVLDLVRLRRFPVRPIALQAMRKNRTPLRMEVSVTPVYSRQGALAVVEGVARDVTALRPEAEAARIGERFLRAAFEALPVGLAHFAADGRFLHVNRRLCEMTGFATGDLLARHFQDIAHPDDAGRTAALLQQLQASEAPQATVEHRIVCKDGSEAWVKLTTCRLRSPGKLESLAVVELVPEPRAAEPEQRRVTYWGIEVDTDRLEVTWNGRRVQVTLKEVLLLRYLIRHRGEMLARDRLLRDVWGYEHAGRSRTLDVHVCRLRRKFPPLADSLATIGHFGYTLSHGVNGAPPAGT